jgi:uncharacterized protein (TIGR02270 family)
MRPPPETAIPLVVRQHVDGSGVLRNVRGLLAWSPHVRIDHLRRIDERIEGHLDGVMVAGRAGQRSCEAMLDVPDGGAMFVAGVGAIQDPDPSRFGHLLALAETASDAQPGLIACLGWASAERLRGTVKTLLESPSPFRRRLGIAACAMHRVDPGPVLDAAIKDADPALRARALKAAGELGRLDLLPLVQQYLHDKDPPCRFRAAWSAVLLGDRAAAVDTVKFFAQVPGAFRRRAAQLLLKVLPLIDAHEFLKGLAKKPEDKRALIEGAGVSGDPHYVPWLIQQMADDKLARLAGESFSFITGADLAALDLERKPPENFESGPNDDPDDDNVAMDEDDGLPWPDAAKVASWWQANVSRFQSGVRHFMGATVSRAHCIQVLKDGYQRQRIAAALYLVLLQPGTKLFEWRAPAWRQQRALAELT